MRLLTITQFADECGCTYEAIRKKIGKEIEPHTESPVTIDADKYGYIIQTFQNKRSKD